MIYVLTGVFLRIISNSGINVFQKILTKNNNSSIINFYTYLGLSIFSLILIPFVNLSSITSELIINAIFMGILGALGNYFIIKALSLGELSSLAPINSYKPVVAMLFAVFYLKEIPSLFSILGILLIIFGTYLLHKKSNFNKTALYLRVLALVFSGIEAVFIKKIIILTNIQTAFILWAFFGLLFSAFSIFKYRSGLRLSSINNLIFLTISACVMQMSTNYVFSKMNVSYALALFQLSTLLSVILGVNIFHEEKFFQKLIASSIMFLGAVIIILCP